MVRRGECQGGGGWRGGGGDSAVEDVGGWGGDEHLQTELWGGAAEEPRSSANGKQVESTKGDETGRVQQDKVGYRWHKGGSLAMGKARGGMSVTASNRLERLDPRFPLASVLLPRKCAC